MKTFNKQITTSHILNANYISPFVPLKNMFMYAITATITGTPTGTIKLQASSDPETDTIIQPFNYVPTNFVDITDSTFTVTTAGKTMWNVTDVAYNYVQVVYTDTSGGLSTATVTIVFNGKGQ